MNQLGRVSAFGLLVLGVVAQANAGFVSLTNESPIQFQAGDAEGELHFAVFHRVSQAESDLGDAIHLAVGQYAYLYQLVNTGIGDFNSVTVAFNDAPINNGGVVDASAPEIPELLSRFDGGGLAASFSAPGDQAQFTFADNLEPNDFTQVLFYRSFTSPTTGLVTIANDNEDASATSITRSATVASVPLPPVFALILTGLPFIGLLRCRRRA